MRLKARLPLIAVLFLLALPLIFTGNASAMYMMDGGTPTGTGGWNAPTDGICVLSIDINGNMVTDNTITTKRDCDARLVAATAVTTGDTLANVCGNTTKNTAGLKYAAPGSSTCVTIDGSGYITGSKSMVNLDRGAVMCNLLGGQLANATATTLSNGAVITTATKTVANGTAAQCIAYGWQYRGQNASGTPLTFGAKGVAQAAGTGYCYTTMNMTTAYSTSATCPSVGAAQAPFNANAAYDWSFSSGKCTYAKGIAGYINAALTKADGTTTAAGTYVDLSTKATQGDCLAFGASWANWTGQAASTTSVATTPTASTIPAWNYTAQAPDADAGCLHCHSYKSQQNGPAERFKDSYLKTGHKNMLRKVTAGQSWAGPDGVVYTTDGTVSIDFSTATVTGGKKLFYIYGDWMIASPTLVYETVAGNNTSAYTCGACHTTGYSDATTSISGVGAATIPGVQSIGTPGYAGVQPQASFPSLSLGTLNPKWDLEGITCARCHNAEVGPINSTMIAASPYTTTAPTSGGMGALASGTGRANLCFGCHQSIDKVWPAGTTNTTDPTQIPVGVSHGAAPGRDFNGHVLGNSFLNSPHARYTGTIKLNSLGKYDLSDPNGTTEYNSIFKGYTCWQSSSSNSPAKTKDTTGAEISNKADCETLYGAGAWRADASGDLGTKQGSCTTCHDVHNSLFVASQEEAAMRKTCEDCHVNNATTFATDAAAPQVVVSAINHPTGPGTPFDTNVGSSPCVVCHMATQAEANGNQNSMPVHVWRINTDVNYNTFPTTGQFYGGACSVHTGAVQNAPYLPVVYLSDTSSANCTAATGTWTAVTKTRSAQTAPDGPYANAVWVDLDFACGQCHGGSFGNTNIHNGAPYYTKAQLSPLAAAMHNGSGSSFPTSHNAPVASCGAALGSGTTSTTFSLTTAASTADTINGVAPKAYVNWGDGSAMASGAIAGPFAHQYQNNGSYNVTLVVKDALGYSATCTNSATVSNANGGAAYGTYTVTTSPAMQNVNVYLKNPSAHTSFQGATVAAGTLTLPKMANSMATGNYSMYVYAPSGKTCYTDAGHTTPFVNGTSVAVTGSTTLYCQ